MTTEELDDLRKKAEAATPGPWVVQAGGTAVIREDLPYTIADCGWPTEERHPGRAVANSDYVAAANPEAVLRLLDHVAFLENILADAQGDARAYFPEARLQGREEGIHAVLVARESSYSDASDEDLRCVAADVLVMDELEPESIRDMRKRLAEQDELIAALKGTVEYYKRRCPPESEGRYGMD